MQGVTAPNEFAKLPPKDKNVRAHPYMPKTAGFSGIIILLFLLSQTVGVLAADWPGWLGPNRDGISPDTGLLKEWPPAGPKLLWKITGIGKGFSSVSVVGNRIYITGVLNDTLVVTALDLNGRTVWKTPHDKAYMRSYPGSRSTPTIDQGKLYIISGNGLIGCYDARNGRRIWTRRMQEFGGKIPGWGYAESVLIFYNLAIVTPGGKNCIVALNKHTGAGIWASQGFKAGAQYSSCIVFDYRGIPLIVNDTSEGLVCVDARNGRVLWSNPFSAHNTANCPTPAYSNGYIFWANGYGKGGICLKLGLNGGRITATEAWRTRDMNCHHGGYIIRNGYIYGNNGSGWACLELKTGRKMWQEKGVGKGSIFYADNMLYLFSERKGLAGLARCSPQGMKMKGKFNVQGSGPSWAHPVVINGRLYLRYDDNLYCFDVRANNS